MALRAQQVSGTDAGLVAALSAADLPAKDLAEAGRHFFSFDADGSIIGYGGFEPHGRYALLLSIVVLPEARGKRLGRAIVEDVMQKAAAEHCSEAYLLTTTAADFFAHLGFAPIDRSAAPQDILATRQAMSICSTAALLTRKLRG